MSMRTKHFVYLFAFFLFSLAISLTFFAQILLILAFTSVVLIAVGYLSYPPDDDSVVIEREQEEAHTYEGEEFTVGLTVENHSDSRVFLEIKDELPKNIKVIEGSNHHLLFLDPQEEKKIEYKIKFLKTENYRIGPVKVRYS
ncbi:MAG: hypothetical protein ACOC55_01870, partial [Candidatus Natronoplasma sp.]